MKSPPLDANHWIGKTSRIASVLLRDVPKMQSLQTTDPLERCLLFLGPPGVGKSTLALALAIAIAQHHLCVQKKNGQSVSVDDIRQWMEDWHYRPLYGKATVKVIEEIDAMGVAACNDARSWLDDLPPGNVVIATTNKTIDKLQEQLQTRFQAWYFEKVPTQSITKLIAERFTKLSGQAAQIATGACGNVRAALADAGARLRVLNEMEGK